MIYARRYLSLSLYIRWASLLLVSLCIAAPAHASTVRTASNYSELVQAITDSSATGDEIRLTDNIVIDDAVTIDKSLTIDGDGFEITVPQPGLDAMGRFNTDGSNFRVFTVTTSSTAVVTLKNLNLRGGAITSGNGGAILVGSGVTLTLKSVQIDRSRSSNGGGAIAASGVVYLDEVYLRRNAAEYGGGLLVSGGSVYVESSALIENRSTSTSGGGGGAEVQSGARLFFNNSTLANNQSTEIGGAINSFLGTVWFVNSSATGNVAFGDSNSTGGAIGNNSGDVYIVNSLLAYNYRRTTGDVDNPTGYVLDDLEPFSNVAGIRIYDSIHHASLPTGLGDNVDNTSFTGQPDGSDNTLFSGGLLSKITDNDGNEIGDELFRPFLYETSDSIAPTLKSGSFVSANRGTPTRFSSDNNSPAIAYFDGSAWVDLTGTSQTSDLVTTDQQGTARDASEPSRGAIESELNETLYIVKVNGAANGTVEGGSIYGDVYASGAQVTLTALANDNFRFDRWDFQAGGTASTNNPYRFSVTKDEILIPVFSSLGTGEFTVTYIDNGATGGEAPSGGVFDSDYTVKNAGSLARTDFTFAGWNTESNGSGDDFSAGDTFPGPANLVLYAQWTESEAPATESPANGSTESTGSVTVSSTAGSITGSGFILMIVLLAAARYGRKGFSHLRHMALPLAVVLMISSTGGMQPAHASDSEVKVAQARVLDQNDQGIAGVNLVAEPEDSTLPTLTTQSSDEGHFEFELMRGVTYFITATLRDEQGNVVSTSETIDYTPPLLASTSSERTDDDASARSSTWPAWYVGAQGLWLQTDVSGSDIQSNLDKENINGNASVDNTGRLGARLYGGLWLHERISLELAWLEWSPLDVDIEQVQLNLKAEDLRDIMPVSGRGAELSVLGHQPVVDDFSVYGRLGWMAMQQQIELEFSDGSKSQDERWVNAPSLGLGVNYQWHERLSVRLGADWYNMPNYSTFGIGLGAQYSFH